MEEALDEEAGEKIIINSRGRIATIRIETLMICSGNQVKADLRVQEPSLKIQHKEEGRREIRF